MRLLAERIKTLRRAKGWSQEQPAERHPWQRSNLVDLELGRRNPSVRTLAKVAKPWLHPSMTPDEYFTPELPAEKTINIMMGALQRIWVYAQRGWSAPQPIPVEVHAAYDRLVALGFTKHLIAED